MRGVGGERVIRSLFALPRMGARAIILALPYAIKQSQEEELYRVYIAKCVQMLTENTAKMCHGRYITLEYTELISPKKQDDRKPEEIVSDILTKAGIEVNNT